VVLAVTPLSKSVYTVEAGHGHIMDMKSGYEDHRDYENTLQNEEKECPGSMLPLTQSYSDTLQYLPARIS
jgi:hypothetical protein